MVPPLFESGKHGLRLVLSHQLRWVALLAALWLFGGKPAAAQSCSSPNPIVCENQLPGSNAWGVSGSGDLTIQGFADDISVNLGQTINFKISTPANSYHIDIYRLGYYQGLGGHLVTTIKPSASLPQTQPTCVTDPTTFLYDCGNWAVSASWQVPASATSGLYIAVPTRDDTKGASQIPFIVRNDSRNSDILFQTSDETWEAYNPYGGHSLYGDTGFNLPGRAKKVSYNRPYWTRSLEAATWLFNAEYPMIKWLERNGYDVTYFTDVDAVRNANLIANHKIYLSTGHDEYWSGPRRANVQAAVSAGVNLAFFSGNEMFWKTRWENSIDGKGTPYRTLVCYKETLDNAKTDPNDPPTWTGTWMDPRFSPPADGGLPQNALTGTLFQANGPGNDNTNLSIQVPSIYAQTRFWRNTSIASLQSGQVATLPAGTLGYEWDADIDNGFRPAGLFDLSSSTATLQTDLLLDYGGTYGAGKATHSLTMYRAPSGALVFGAGTVQWSWGLDSDHDGGSLPPDIRMQQATANLFADMGAQPSTLQSGLVMPVASTDNIAPVSTITSPAQNATVAFGSLVTITGTASDLGGGVVAGVEVSTDGGKTWHPAIGRDNWTYAWTALASGSATLLSRAVDDSGNLEIPGAGVTVKVPGVLISSDVVVSADLPTASASVTTPAFSTVSGNELLLAFIAADYLGGPNTTITNVNGAGLTWTLVARTNAESGTAEIWRAFAPNPLSNVTVTATLSQSVLSSITVKSFSGVNTSGSNGSGAIGAIGSGHSVAGAPSASLTTTQNGSWIFGVGNDFSNAIARSPGTGQTLIHEYLTPTGDTYWVQMANAPTPVSGTIVTLNDTQPTTDAYNLTICEILPALAPTYSISGSIAPSSVGSGATVTFAGPTNAVATADALGHFTSINLANGVYTLTPGKPGFTFTPPTQTLTLNGSNISGVSFTATALPTYSVSGTITGGAGAIVTLTPTGESGTNATATADASGNYTFSQVLSGGYTVTPSKTGFTFTPVNQTILVNAALPGVNFVAVAVPLWSISGSVSPLPAGSGVTVTLSGAGTGTATSDSSGIFSFPSESNGTYILSASKSGYSFNPATQTAVVNGAGITGLTFAAQPQSAGIQLVQANTAGSETTGSAISASFTSPNAAGNLLIVVGAASHAASSLSISDTAGNTYLPAIGPVNDPIQAASVYVWYVANCRGGTNTVTITPAVADALEIHVSEFSGADPIAPFDQSSFATGNSVSPSSGVKTTSVNGELVYGYEFVAPTTSSVGSGFTGLSFINGDWDEYEIQPVAGSVAATFTQPAGEWLALMATFRPAGAFRGTISGTISPVAAGSGATVTLSGAASATVTADASGNYSFAGLLNGAYTVTPAKIGYTFTPASKGVTVSSSNVSGVNFSGVVQAPPTISLSSSYLLMAATPGSNPASSSVTVTNTGGGTLSFSAASDSNWLSVAPANGTAPQQLQFSAASAALPVGTYTGHITITATGATNSPAAVTVVMNIGVAADWLMVDHDSSRSGNAVDETTITPSNVSNLQLSWSAAVDGSVTAQPLYVHGLQIAGQTHNVLLVATGGNSIYAMDADAGTVIWKRNFGASTPSTYGLPDGFGIEAPPVIDRATNRIYTVSTDGNFRTISLLDGTDVFPALTLIANPVTNKVWGGLNKVGNSVYIASASNGGDVAPWRGQVYQVDVSATPTLAGDFVVVPSIPAPNGGGGVWGYGGVSADPISGHVFGSSAYDSQVGVNGNEGTTPYADSMFALTSSMNLLGYYQPPQPNTFPCGGAPCDLDFASTPVYFEPAGCPAMVAAGNKNGNLYLFRVSDLIASGQPAQILTLNNPYDSIGLGGIAGVPAFSPSNNMLYIGDAGNGVTGVSAGIVALRVTSNCALQVAWSNQLASGNDIPNSTPTVANGVVFIGEGVTGIIHAYNAQTGAQLWQSGSSYKAAATFAAPIVANGKLYAGSWSSFNGGGIVGAFALPNANPILAVSPGTLSFNASFGGSTPPAATVNVNNSGSGTLTFTAASDSPWLTVSPASGTAPQALQATASIAGLAVGTYTGHITVTAAGVTGSPTTVTVTLTVSSASGTGSLAIDATSFKDNSAASTTITTAAFSTTSANELLLAFIATDGLPPNMSVTSVTGAGLTWSLVVRTNAQGGTAEIWRAFATVPLSNVTVTANLAQSITSSMAVVTFTGADATGTNGSGAIGATGTANGTSAPSASLTTTRNNSWVFGVGNDYDKAIARTLAPNQTLVHQYLSPSGDTYWMQRLTAPTAASGSNVTLNDTAPTGDHFNLSIVEIKAALSSSPTFTVSGTVSPVAAGSNAVLTLSGAATGSATADSSGNYTFPNLANGSYTVTPAKTGYTFTPVNQAITVNGSNITAVNFAGSPIPTYTISGTVSPVAAGSGTVLTLSGAATGTATADASGTYSFPNLANASYTVTPAKPGYAFTPVSQAVAVNGANMTGVNFTASTATTIGRDAAVSKDGSTASTTLATPAFSTTSQNELLLAFVSTDYLSGTNTTVTGVAGGGLTWVLVARSNTQSGTAEIWRTFASSTLTNVTVTATLSQSVNASITVLSFAGVDTSGTNGSGAIGATKTSNADPGAPTASLVTTRNNSLVMGVGNDFDNAIARTPGAGQSLVHQFLSPAGDTYWVQTQNSPTPVSGTTVTLNDTAPATDRYNLAICEILP